MGEGILQLLELCRYYSLQLHVAIYCEFKLKKINIQLLTSTSHVLRARLSLVAGLLFWTTDIDHGRDFFLTREALLSPLCHLPLCPPIVIAYSAPESVSQLWICLNNTLYLSHCLLTSQSFYIPSLTSCWSLHIYSGMHSFVKYHWALFLDT